jgi:hypothetical protein
MRLLLDMAGKETKVSLAPEPRMDPTTGKQRVERGTDKPQWSVQVIVDSDDGAEVIRVTVAGEKPKVDKGQQVRLVGLEAIPWRQNDRHGVAYRAEQILAASAVKAA